MAELRHQNPPDQPIQKAHGKDRDSHDGIQPVGERRSVANASRWAQKWNDEEEAGGDEEEEGDWEPDLEGADDLGVTVAQPEQAEDDSQVDNLPGVALDVCKGSAVGQLDA